MPPRMWHEPSAGLESTPPPPAPAMVATAQSAQSTVRSNNRLALVLLIVGKLLGVAGLVVGSHHRAAGATLLGLDAVLIVAAVTVALRTMKAGAVEDDGHKALLRQMMKEGTLKQHLRDLEAEMAQAKATESVD